MNIYKERFFITTENSYLDFNTCPKMYADCFVHKADLVRLWYDETMFYFELGLFGKFVSVGVVINKKTRKRTEKEEARYREFNEAFKNNKCNEKA